MLKNLEMLLRSTELTHASDKFDFATKEFGAGSTRHVPQWALTRFGIGPIHGRRNGVAHQRRPLVNRAYGSRDISLSKA